ncbi:MAG: endonuclease/exonuclease/phosphatase family protein, partial [Mucinivorans sp.]
MKILPKNRVLRIIVYVVLCVVAALGITLAVFWAGEWTPEPMEVMYDKGPSGDSIPTKLKIVSWNIGYAGLGSDMDFFYDGGNSVQTSKERTETNMHKIIEFLQQNRDADFILLQEVDFPSKRSYYLNEYDSLRAALPEFMGWWGLNYVSQYVPIPLTNPIGSVKAGVVILTRHQPQQVVRYSYPSKFPFPVSIFNLKRCLLEASFAIVGSDQTFYLGNTHNTAYDRGGMRSKEMEFLKNFLFGKRFSFTAGDWNSNPPLYVASKAERDDKYFP